jgi:hypothetical protein
MSYTLMVTECLIAIITITTPPNQRHKMQCHAKWTVAMEPTTLVQERLLSSPVGIKALWSVLGGGHRGRRDRGLDRGADRAKEQGQTVDEP